MVGPLTRTLLIGLICCFPSLVAANWEPGPDADPHAVLHSAEADIRAGRYEDALEKQIWFHHHALDRNDDLAGVRLSAALMSWHELGKKYPHAMTRLKAARDDSEKQVLRGKGDIFRAFMELDAINEELGEETKTVDVFAQLDKESPRNARRVYPIAQSALVNAKKFSLCGKYLEPNESLRDLVTMYKAEIESSTKQKNERWRDNAERNFLNEAGTLIALLTLNDRKSEAANIAKEVRDVSNHPAKARVIDAAVRGELPHGLMGVN